MPKVQLTDRFCATAKPLNNQRTDYFDSIANGLALRVTKYGHKSWSYCFTSPRNNTWSRLTLGTYPAASLALARGKALEARANVEAGIDPRFPGQASADMTVGALVEAFLADPQRQALRTKREIARRFRRNVVPAIGNVKLTQLKRRDVRNVTDAILRRGAKAEANRCFEDIHALVRWAVVNEYMDVNPIDGMERPAKGNARTRVLSDDEIKILWDGLPAALANTQCRNVIKLCLVTGQRVGEVCGLTRAELDLKARVAVAGGARQERSCAPHSAV
jgi:hypothetical protein